jgi:hypothetical protein
MRERIAGTYLVLFLLALAPREGAQSFPAPLGLGSAELVTLEQGKPVFRILGKSSELSLPAMVPGGSAALDAVSRLAPNYLVEVIASYPAKGHEAAFPSLAATLANVEGYVGLPYYSEKYAKTYDLFDSAKVLSRDSRGGQSVIEALMHMKPFDEYKVRYQCEATQASLVFSGSNLDYLVYKGIKAVKPGEMIWRIVAYRSGDRLYFHGIGAVKAFDMFGAVRDRLEPSFVGRTKAFFLAMQDKIRG